MISRVDKATIGLFFRLKKLMSIYLSDGWVDMRFTLEQLRLFTSIAETSSFSATARQVGKAQSAVSTAVANLELELGVDLFSREGHKPHLTVAGKALLEEARAILMRAQVLEERAFGFTQQVEAELVVAVDDAIPLAAIGAILGKWQEEYPSVELRLIRLPVQDAPERLIAGTLDLALLPVQPNYSQDLAFQRIGQLRMVEVARSDHPLARRHGIGFAELSDHRQLVYAPHGQTISTSEYVISPQRSVTESYAALLVLLEEGLGWAMVPYRLVSKALSDGRLVDLNLEAYPFTPWWVGIDLLWCRRRALGRAGQALRAELSRTPI